MQLAQLLNKYSVIGIVGNKSTGKTSLALCELLQLKQRYPHVDVVPWW